MPLSICVLGSGSAGNSALVESDKAKILIDAGLGEHILSERIRQAYARPEEIDGILITHTHGDHICGLKNFVKKYGPQVFAHRLSLPEVAELLGGYRHVTEIEEGDFFLKDLTVSPFRVNHDVHCLGYSIYCGGRKISVLTDLGILPERIFNNISDSDIVVLESNHDTEKLKSNPRYPARLKARIAGASGHLSNEACAEVALRLARYGTRQIVLAHLSEKNNSPELAYNAVARRLSEENFFPGRNIYLDIALQGEPTKIFKIS